MKNGILPINKPEGLSSAKAVARIKKILKVKKVGHTGTLDPFATGLLLCGIDKGTRISRFFLDGHKRYTATILLGVETDTYDKTGKVVSSVGVDRVKSIENKTIEKAVAGFRGVQEQVPPSFSALKHQGQPLYKLARQGKMIQKPARTIEIFDIRITKFDLPYIDIDLFCSSGTYIRTIAFDIGQQLGCGAHLTALCRTRSSQFDIKKALEWDALVSMDRESIEKSIVPMSEALSFLPKTLVKDPVIRKIQYGQKLDPEDLGTSAELLASDQTIRVVDSKNNLLALVVFNEKRKAYDYSCVFAS